MDVTTSSTVSSLGAGVSEAAQPLAVSTPATANGGTQAATALPWDSNPALPSVGRGQSLNWAKSWVELSRGMNTLGMAPETAARGREMQQGSVLDSANAVADRVAEMTRASATTTVTAVRFTLMSGIVQGASSAVHKLLSQQ